MGNLNRFIDMQEKEYSKALKEIRNGKKLSHWIWYIFPQIKGLGMSSMANYYGIDNIEEAKEYLNNNYLRNNLLEITEALLNINNNDPTDILGYPDDLKVKSSMTLFYLADPSINLFKDVLDKYYNGELDNNTMDILGIKRK